VKLDPPATYPKIWKFIEDNFPEEVKKRPSLRIRIRTTLAEQKERFPRQFLTPEERQQEREKFPELYTSSNGIVRAPSYKYMVNPDLAFGYFFSF
jgi:hypothetical protein